MADQTSSAPPSTNTTSSTAPFASSSSAMPLENDFSYFDGFEDEELPVPSPWSTTPNSSSNSSTKPSTPSAGFTSIEYQSCKSASTGDLNRMFDQSAMFTPPLTNK